MSDQSVRDQITAGLLRAAIRTELADLRAGIERLKRSHKQLKKRRKVARRSH